MDDLISHRSYVMDHYKTNIRKSSRGRALEMHRTWIRQERKDVAESENCSPGMKGIMDFKENQRKNRLMS